MNIDFSNLFKNIDLNKVVQAAVIIALFGIFILSLTFIIPVLGALIAFGIILVVGYVIYLFLNGKVKP